jgi:hypothetical protein
VTVDEERIGSEAWVFIAVATWWKRGIGNATDE